MAEIKKTAKTGNEASLFSHKLVFTCWCIISRSKVTSLSMLILLSCSAIVWRITVFFSFVFSLLSE